MSTRPWKTAIPCASHAKLSSRWQPLRHRAKHFAPIKRESCYRSFARKHRSWNATGRRSRRFLSFEYPDHGSAAGTARAYSGAGAPTQDRKYGIDDQCAAGDKAGIRPEEAGSDLDLHLARHGFAAMQQSCRSYGSHRSFTANRLVHGFRGTLDFTAGVRDVAI